MHVPSQLIDNYSTVELYNEVNAFVAIRMGSNRVLEKLSGAKWTVYLRISHIRSA